MKNALDFYFNEGSEPSGFIKLNKSICIYF